MLTIGAYVLPSTAVHVKGSWQTEAMQCCPPGHGVPHAPQCASDDVVFVSQPFDARESQSANRVAHTEIAQAREEHVAVASGSAHGAHVRAPHPKLGSRSLTHDAPQACSPAAHVLGASTLASMVEPVSLAMAASAAASKVGAPSGRRAASPAAASCTGIESVAASTSLEAAGDVVQDGTSTASTK